MMNFGKKDNKIVTKFSFKLTNKKSKIRNR